MPLTGPDFYRKHNPYNKHVVFPVGLLVLRNGTIVVSYGWNDHKMRVAHYDRSKLMDTLQAPLLAEWTGPPC